MNEELTREVLEAMVKCDTICSRCKAVKLCSEGIFNTLRILATALLDERAKPKAWDGAPEWAKSAIVMWSDTCKNEPANRRDYSPLYTRELPKTRARQIAEEIVDEINIRPHRTPVLEPTVETVMRVLNKYAEELKGEA